MATVVARYTHIACIVYSDFVIPCGGHFVPTAEFLTDPDALSPAFNPLKAKLNPSCHLLALLGAHHILHVSRVRVNRPNPNNDGVHGTRRQSSHAARLNPPTPTPPSHASALTSVRDGGLKNHGSIPHKEKRHVHSYPKYPDRPRGPPSSPCSGYRGFFH